MVKFGVLVMSSGHDRIFYISEHELTIDNIDIALKMHANYRIPGDLDHAYDFLTNPERKGEHNLYIGNSESYLGDEEEYFFVRPEHVGGNDGFKETSTSNGGCFYSDN